MKNLTLKYLVAIIIMLSATSIKAQEVLELKKTQGNKIVVKLMFKNGSITDPKGKEGLTHLTANLITQGGSAEYSKSQIEDMIFPMAASYGSNVDKEVSVFTFQVHKDFEKTFYPIIKGLITTPSFTEADFNRLKSNQQNYVDQVIRASSDEEYSKMALEDFLFRGTNYQHMIAGTSAGVSSITLDVVKEHYKKYFTKNNLMIGIAGNYSEEFLNQLKADMGSLPSLTTEIPSPAKLANVEGVHVEIISKDNALGSAIYTGFPLSITRSNDEFAALMVANSYLGEHRKSYGKLFQKIRETRSMNYGSYSYIEWYDKGGSNMLPRPGVPRQSNYFSLWIRPVQIGEQLRAQYPELKNAKIGHAHFALRMAVKEVDNMIKDGISKEEFELTRTFLRSYIKLYTETLEKELGFLMDSRYYDRKDFIREADQILSKLTVEDVNNAIRKHFQVNNMFVTIVTDDSEALPLAESMKKNITSPMSYSNLVKEGLPAIVLQEDEKVANYRLNVKTVRIIKDKDTFKN
jgi:zinc protease